MVISILGCGWYGKALAGALIKQGITVKGSATSVEKVTQLTALNIQPYEVNFQNDEASFDPTFFDCDVMVISIPPKFRSGQTANYLPKLSQVSNAIVKYGIQKVIYISSTGVYGDVNSEVNESIEPLPDNPSGDVLLAAEKLLANNPAFKTTILRFAGLFGPGRHPGRFFAGKTNIPNGRAPVNLVHLDDCVAVTTAVLKKEAYGRLFNVCSPHHPTKAEFYTYAAKQAGLTPPAFIDELLNWKIVKSSLHQLPYDYCGTNLFSVLSYST